MDQRSDVDELDRLRADIAGTRSALSNKLESVEQELRDNVRRTTDSVVDTLHTVKETFTGTIDEVRDRFTGTVNTIKSELDVRQHVQAHPWIMVAGSAAAGFAAARLLPPAKRAVLEHSAGERISEYSGSRMSATNIRKEPRRPGILESVVERFEPELRRLQGLAIGSAMGIVRGFVRDTAPPSMAEELDNIIQSATEKMGGRPVDVERPSWARD
jgi:ElaB/YqjD/DUF883 family membrane-anchored ribosome-binding protein